MVFILRQGPGGLQNFQHLMLLGYQHTQYWLYLIKVALVVDFKHFLDQQLIFQIDGRCYEISQMAWDITELSKLISCTKSRNNQSIILSRYHVKSNKTLLIFDKTGLSRWQLCYHCLEQMLSELWPLVQTVSFNPLRAKFLRENINLYLHFMSFLHTNKKQVAEIPPRVRHGPAYSTWSISWLLMSWRHKEPGHQQQCYWPS